MKKAKQSESETKEDEIETETEKAKEEELNNEVKDTRKHKSSSQKRRDRRRLVDFRKRKKEELIILNYKCKVQDNKSPTSEKTTQTDKKRNWKEKWLNIFSLSEKSGDKQKTLNEEDKTFL